MANPPRYPGAPRWVKVSGIIGGVLLLLVAIVIFARGGPSRHGPGRHISPSSIAELGVQRP